MAINFFGKLLKKNTTKEINYLSLTITSKKIIALIWVFENESIKVLGHAEKDFNNIDGLLHGAASAIDAAGKHATTDVSEVVYGLSGYWFENGKISKESANILKDMSEELDLNAQAFVPLSASINHYLKIRDRVNPHVILVGAVGEFLEVHLLKDNEVVMSKIEKGSPSAQKITHLLKQIKAQVAGEFPSKILVFGTGIHTKFKDELDRMDFKELFVQTPKIEAISNEELAISVAVSQGADFLGHDPFLPDFTPHQEVIQDSSTSQIDKDVIPQETTGENLGFVEGADILETEKEEVELQEPIKATNQKEYAVEVEKPPEESQAEHIHTSPKELVEHEEKDRPKKESIIDRLTTLTWLPSGKFGKTPNFKKLLPLLVILVILFIVGSFVLSKSIVKADAKIKINAKPQEDQFEVSAVNNSSYDAEKLRLGASEIKAAELGSQKATVSGKKKIGNFAKGEVTVFNWTTQKTNFKKDTVVITKSGIKFELDGDVEVASRSASTPGEAKAPVAAADFGTSGNIEASQDFTFQEYDDLLYSARNNNAFSGGDEKEVTVVTKNDLSKLEKSLTDSLTQKAKTKLNDVAANANQAIDESAVQIKVTKKTFDKKEDEEASLLNLDMEVEASVLVYQATDLKNLLAEISTKSDNSNLEARPDNIEILDLDAKRSKDTIILSGKYRANLIPKFQDDELKNRIAGLSIKDARTKIKEIGEVEDVTFTFKPAIPLISSLPKNKENITLSVEVIK